MNLVKIASVVVGAIIVAGILYLYIPRQNMSVEWSRTFNRSYNDSGSFVLPTDDGCIVAGYTESRDSIDRDVWILKIDNAGNEIWNYTFGGKAWDNAKAIQQTNDGYLIVGSTSSFGHGGSDVWLIKIDINGRELWNHTFGGSGWETGNAIERTHDNKYLITGYTSSYGKGNGDLWLVKIDENGNEIWNHTIGGENYDEGRAIASIEGGYIIAGLTESYGSGATDAWLVKVDENGKEIWNYTFGSGNNDLFNAIIESNDTGFVAVGHTLLEKPGHWAGLVVKVDSNGTEQWEKIISDDSICGISSIDLADDGYILVGYSGYNETQDNLVVKLDSNGNILWKKSFGDIYGDAGVWIKGCGENEFLIAGYRDVNGKGNYDIWLLKISA